MPIAGAPEDFFEELRMTYLAIMFLLAGAGILRLWLQQRRERSHIDTVDGFKAGLEAISAPTSHVVTRPASTPRHRSERPVQVGRPVRAAGSSTLTLDPARREAAKRRLEARRRSVNRTA